MADEPHPSYDDAQFAAERLTCARCGAVRDVTKPRPDWVCSACRDSAQREAVRECPQTLGDA